MPNIQDHIQFIAKFASRLAVVGLEDWIVCQGDPRWELCLESLQTSSEIGFDIETYSTLAIVNKKDPMAYLKGAESPLTGEIRLMQVYLPSLDLVMVWDLGSCINRTKEFQGINYTLENHPDLQILLKVLADIKVKKFIQNASFEMFWMNVKFATQLFNIVDTLRLSQIFWAGMFKGMQKLGMAAPNSLKWIAFRLGKPALDKTDQTFDYALPTMGNRQINYAATDPKVTHWCGIKLLERCHTQGLQKVVDAELRCIPTFGELKYKGFPTCPKELDRLEIQHELKLAELYLDWEKLAPGVAARSPKQILNFLTTNWDLRDEDGNVITSTSVETIARFRETNPVIKTLFNIRSLEKLLGTYIRPLKEAIKTNAMGFTVVQPSYNQIAYQGTGRSSATNPAVQTIPNQPKRLAQLGLTRIRDVFRCPKGYKMIIMDIDGCHAQIGRLMSQDRTLCEARDKGVKSHYYTISKILELQGVSVSPADASRLRSAYKKKTDTSELAARIDDTYDVSKNIYYTVQNGGGKGSLQAEFRKEKGGYRYYTLEECDLFIKAGRETYSGLSNFVFESGRRCNAKTALKVPVWLDKDGELFHWGYYGDRKKQLSSACLTAPPGAFSYKWCGVMPPGLYSEVRSLDGGRYFVEKFPNRYRNDGSWDSKVGDIVAFFWQRVEATAIKNCMGILTEKFHFESPHWNAWISLFNHDEIDVICKEEYASECAKLTFDTLYECLRELIEDYIDTEVKDTDDLIFDIWRK